MELLLPPILMIGTAALLIGLGARQPKMTWSLILAALLPLIVLCIWISTVASGDGLIAFIVAIYSVPITSLITVVALLVYLPRKRKLLAGIIVPFATLSIFLSIQVGATFSPDAIIKQNAKTIAQALVQYHSDYGIYPNTLKDLMPHYVGNLQEPQTIWGWVYKVTNDTFFIGYVSYVDRDGYSVCYWSLDANILKWDCLLPPDSWTVFALGPTPMSPLVPNN